MKILIIKLGAKGDVVRTLPILVGIKERYPDSEITWITKPYCKEILETSSYINKILTLPDLDNVNDINISTADDLKKEGPLITSDNNLEINKIPTNNNLNKILIEKFDVLYNFDMEKEATELTEKIKADRKYGFYSDNKNNKDYANSFNLSGEYYLNTLFDDETKKSNKKTYQEMMFDIAEIPYKKQLPTFNLSYNDKKYGEQFLINNGLKDKINKKIIGIHVSAGKRWPSKKWHLENLKEFIIKLKTTKIKNNINFKNNHNLNNNEKSYEDNDEVLLFVGPNEKNYYDNLIKELEHKKIKIYISTPRSDKEFFSLMSICNKIVSGDSFALHVALALKKPTIGLFFCTPPNEIEDYGLLKKIVSPLLYGFFPEKMDIYDEQLTKSVSADEVLDEIKKLDD
ncbi:MAG: glycosyltransferase family 9 protein [Nanoarchaeota archaeon]